MKPTLISFGILDIDGTRFERDVVIDRGRIARRDKKASRPLRDRIRHTPLSLLEPIPWNCRRLIVGTGAGGALPIVPDVLAQARRRGVELVALPTDEACALLADADPATTNAILHVTCDRAGVTQVAGQVDRIVHHEPVIDGDDGTSHHARGE